jgi:predicted dehydrogenase
MAARLGTVGMLTTEFAKAPHFPGFREVMADPLLVDMAIHPFDTARYLLDQDPVAVYCEGFNPPWSWFAGNANAVAVFEMDGGARYVYTGTWCTPGGETSWNGSWRVGGRRGTACWDGEANPVVDGLGGTERDVPDVGLEIAGSLREFASALQARRTPSGEVHQNVMSLVMVEAAVLVRGRASAYGSTTCSRWRTRPRWPTS